MTSQSLHHLGGIDFFILAVIAISIMISFMRGFLREVVSLVIWVVAALASIKLAPLMATHLQAYVKSEALSFTIAFAIIFILMLVLGIFVNMALKQFIEKTGITGTDRMLGIFFGGARGLVVVSVMMMFVSFLPIQSAVWWNSSVLVPQFQTTVAWLDSLLPGQVSNMSRWLGSNKPPIGPRQAKSTQSTPSGQNSRFAANQNYNQM